MKRLTREEMVRDSGARPEELDDLEARRLLVPRRTWHLLGHGEVYYTDGQLDVLRYIVKARRVVERGRSAQPGASIGPRSGAR